LDVRGAGEARRRIAKGMKTIKRKKV
jgi:hypothetical protein